MNSKGIIAIKNEKICMKCLNKNSTHTYEIYGRGYGSIYDSFDTKFQLCDECADNKYDIWVDEIVELDKDEYIEKYEYEDNIDKLIKSFPLESQELFYNRFSDGSCASYYMNPQDWIDYQLDELSHEKCKEYGLYSSQEIKAYEERFPNCEYVQIKKYKDGSQSSKCQYGAFGDKYGNTDVNISSECYMCDHYKPRKGDIKIVHKTKEYYQNEKDRLTHMLQYATTRLKELENDVEKYIELHD